MSNWNFHTDDDWSTDDEDTGLSPEQLRRLRAMVKREVQSAVKTELARIEDKHTFIDRVIEKAKYLFTEAKAHLAEVIDRILDDISLTWYDDDQLVSEIMEEIEETDDFDDDQEDDMYDDLGENFADDFNDDNFDDDEDSLLNSSDSRF
ncbi:MAG: hypothetical protein IPO91_28840 [Chloroflexi bacterium]|nr:hypothetical protein [Chloroflexota bacterium]